MWDTLEYFTGREVEANFNIFALERLAPNTLHDSVKMLYIIKKFHFSYGAGEIAQW